MAEENGGGGGGYEAPAAPSLSNGLVTEGALINLNANEDSSTTTTTPPPPPPTLLTSTSTSAKNAPSLLGLPPVPPRSFENKNGVKTSAASFFFRPSFFFFMKRIMGKRYPLRDLPRVFTRLRHNF